MLERFTPQPLTPERKRYDSDFYRAIALEYRHLESEVSIFAEAFINGSEETAGNYRYRLGPWEKYRLLLKISDQQMEMASMKKTLGFEIGDRDGTKVAGSLEAYNPFEHNLMLDSQEPDLVDGETIIVTHSEVSARIYGERQVLLRAVYDRFDDRTGR